MSSFSHQQPPSPPSDADGDAEMTAGGVETMDEDYEDEGFNDDAGVVGGEDMSKNPSSSSSNNNNNSRQIAPVPRTTRSSVIASSSVPGSAGLNPSSSSGPGAGSGFVDSSNANANAKPSTSTSTSGSKRKPDNATNPKARSGVEFENNVGTWEGISSNFGGGGGGGGGGGRGGKEKKEPLLDEATVKHWNTTLGDVLSSQFSAYKYPQPESQSQYQTQGHPIPPSASSTTIPTATGTSAGAKEQEKENVPLPGSTSAVDVGASGTVTSAVPGAVGGEEVEMAPPA